MVERPREVLWPLVLLLKLWAYGVALFLEAAKNLLLIRLRPEGDADLLARHIDLNVFKPFSSFEGLMDSACAMVAADVGNGVNLLLCHGPL
jgi:hypothetical protein